MNRLIERQQTHIVVNDTEYPIKSDFRNAIITWRALEAANNKELSPLAASFVALDVMLGIEADDLDIKTIEQTLKEISEYLHKYSRISDKDKKDNKPPLLDLMQDGQLIYDGFQKMGIDLDMQEVSYPRFMSLLRELPAECSLCRIIYLRQLVRDGKINKKEYKAEKEECNRIGWDIIKIKNNKKEEEHSEEYNNFIKKFKC